jgi:hypothetical protein
MTSMSITVNEYTGRVLGVIKEKFGLKDKAEALDKFAEMFGEEFVEKEVKDEVVEEVIQSCDNHLKKYGHRKMSVKDFDRLCGLE